MTFVLSVQSFPASQISNSLGVKGHRRLLYNLWKIVIDLFKFIFRKKYILHSRYITQEVKKKANFPQTGGSITEKLEIFPKKFMVAKRLLYTDPKLNK